MTDKFHLSLNPGTPMVGNVIAELVARGIPRNDGRGWTIGSATWSIVNETKSSPDEALTTLEIVGTSADNHSWRMDVLSCPGSDRVTGVEFNALMDSSAPAGTLTFWPGLDEAIAMAQLVASSFIRAEDPDAREGLVLYGEKKEEVTTA